ncbi:MAG: hypothetical protein CVU57_02590 [Deltaproteobacteria bacterium HGW-Deltaproteobacteria-15]|jgi:hypothetical protein|nr:MAG: hypothetical protein CVU57_02590 [Deltaproteobacteria bacterium HGW-Deltaproteobacteria-15]
MKKQFLSLSVTVLLLSLVLPPNPHAATRGIVATTSHGESISVYSDYHALVVGVGTYTAGWPNLPGALKDSKEVASAWKNSGSR